MLPRLNKTAKEKITSVIISLVPKMKYSYILDFIKKDRTIVESVDIYS